MTYFNQKSSEPKFLSGIDVSPNRQGSMTLNTASTSVCALTSTTRMLVKTSILVVALQLSPTGLGNEAHARGTDREVFSSAQDQSWKNFQSEIGMARKNMMADPAKALEYAKNAQELSVYFDVAEKRYESLATSLWLQSEALLRANRIDEARPLLDRALELVGQSGGKSKLVGDLHLALARITRQTGEIDVALNSLNQARKIYTHLGETRSQAIVLHCIGSIYNEARSFELALEHFARANEIFPSDPSLELSAANNSGNAFKELKNYEAALVSFNRALKISKKINSPMLQGRILTNIASVHVMSGNLDAAEKIANQALQTLEVAGDVNWSKFAWGVKADVALARRKTDKAVEYIGMTFAGNNVAQTTSSYRDMHEIAYRVYRSAGRDAQSLNHLTSFKRLDDKGQQAGANMSLALAAAKFNFAASR